MFTGIIQSISLEKTIKEMEYGSEITLKVDKKFLKGLEIGASIAVNGVCLTVTHFTEEKVSFDVIPESLRLTNLSGKKNDAQFNLERSLKMGDEIGGHLVSGHVQASAEVIELIDGKERILKLKIPSEIRDYLFKKGYVALNGVSLTISDISKDDFSVSLIPETLSATNLSYVKKGDSINVEADQQTVAIVDTVKKFNEKG